MSHLLREVEALLGAKVKAERKIKLALKRISEYMHDAEDCDHFQVICDVQNVLQERPLSGRRRQKGQV